MKAREQKLADNGRLLRTWFRWHAEQKTEALAGPHRHVLEPLFAMLKSLDRNSAAELLRYFQAQDWTAVDADTRFIVTNTAIAGMRERAGLAPFDDPLPGGRENLSRTIRSILEGPAPVAGAVSEPMPILKPANTRCETVT